MLGYRSYVAINEPRSFELIDGVWITHPRFVVPVASVLRQSLIELAAARLSQDGQQTKTELVYQYLTGPRFRHRVEAIVERFSEMQDDLNRERNPLVGARGRIAGLGGLPVFPPDREYVSAARE